MTTLLEKAVKIISNLPETEQDEIAKIILEEIENEEVWYKKFTIDQSKLSVLADEARKEFKSGKTKDMNI